uniref:Uncharacterized LOC100175416 n=1 Tax=Ciona intestinalis TaxID=7719 RepID=A0A1W5BJQ3_CIOIN|nr:uncharacterized protein LOC100175416 [Ciona intestinalis]|eukprot:XP_018670422.1 uncharacterized protein LOC100175416 [Ciona intestinalis]
MSCVPSINAYVASHSHSQQAEVQEMTETVITPPPTCQQLKENEKKSWFGSIFDKFSFVGHDGVTLIQEAKKTEVQQDNNMNLLSRVRHLSNSSTESTSTENQDRIRHQSNPDR